jgi:hypothetical protein
VRHHLRNFSNIYNINYNIIINNYPILYSTPQVRLHTGDKNRTEKVDFLSKHRRETTLLNIFFIFISLYAEVKNINVKVKK